MVLLLLVLALLGVAGLAGAALLGLQGVLDHYFPPNPDIAACDKGDADACARMADFEVGDARWERDEADRMERLGSTEAADGYRRNAADSERRAAEFRTRASTGRR